MKLYYSPGACSLSPNIIAHEAGLPLDLVKVDLSTHTTEKGTDFYTINPKGYVPALELDNGEIITEGSVIVQYLADLNKEAKLIPLSGTFDRYRTQELLTYIGTEIHKTFSSLFNKDITPEAREAVVAKLNSRFEHVEKILSGKEFLTGPTFNVTDAYLFTVLNWSTMLNVSLSAYPNITAFMTRVSVRPHVKSAMVAEGLVK